MNKTAIKNYAIWARTKLIEDIKYKAGLLGISEKEIAAPLAQSTNEVQYFAIGTRNPYAISGVQIAQRASLANAIKRKAQEVDYNTAYNQIVEEVAYTWFNRFIAVRFMEVNEYLPCKIRMLSAVDGRQEPDIVQNPFDAKLDYTPSEENLINEYQLNNEGDKLFNLLFIKVCNDLSKVLPQLFEAEDDYTELLLNISYTDRDGLIYKLVHDIPEEDFNIEMGGQVEIIGWLYQSYIAEPKDKLINARKQYKDNDIPFVTQLFTSDWIVKYMVENTLGRMWIGGHPNDFLKSQWKYFLEEGEQEESVKEDLAKMRKHYAQLQPEDIKVIDPCMGSGHILVYAFEVLMQIYIQMGYSEKDASISIVENNLYGLDIDNRAFQLAYFAVLMKARMYNRFILKKKPMLHLYTIESSKNIKKNQLDLFGCGLNDYEKKEAVSQINILIDEFKDAKECGSLIIPTQCNWNLLRKFVFEFDIPRQQDLFATHDIEKTCFQLQELITVAEILSEKYQIVITNPPYMNSSYMPNKLKKFLSESYTDYKYDTFAAFIVRNILFVCDYGHIGMLTPFVWMFISTYESLRDAVLKYMDFTSLVQLEYNAFESACVPVAAFTLRKADIGFIGDYIKLSSFKGCENQGPKTLLAVSNRNCGFRFAVGKKEFSKIPGSPIAYWMSDKVYNCFSNRKLSLVADARSGISTGDNNLYYRIWYECSLEKICFNSTFNPYNSSFKWFPIIRGGDFRKWYGNMDNVINLQDGGRDIRSSGKNFRLRTPDYYNKLGITWNRITSGSSSFRIKTQLVNFGENSPCIFCDTKLINYLMGCLNSKISTELLKILNPTLTYQIIDLQNLPFKISNPHINDRIDCIVNDNILFSKYNWDSFETSWDFQKHPLMPQLPISCETMFIDGTNSLGSVSITSIKLQDEYHRVKESWEKSFLQLKANEEELNRIFIDIYGLQGELTPEVEDKDVTVHRIFDSKEDVPESMKGSNYVLTKQDVVKSLLSYAVGCMFGRYSLDVEGLAYAGGEWDARKYARFIPDPDNVIPITDEDYFEDDIVGRFVEWLKVVYGRETLEENLRFVADALGGSGDTPRQRIRNYFLKDFFKDHCKTYQKRPIYWLYDSGKQNGFKALIYMHRYNKDTTGQVRAEYLGRMEGTYESEINRMEDIKNNGKGREVALAAKRIEKLKKQLKECRDYDEYIGHLALAAIDIDLDDGVKVNYVKVQTAKDGKVLPLLAKI